MPQRIPSHKPPRLAGRPRRDDSKRPNAAARGYCDKAHRAWRQAVLTRDAWQCQACGRVCGDRCEAHADHIVPVSQGGERYDVSNGQCLCVSCHGRKTRGEQAAAATGYTTPPPEGGKHHCVLRELNPTVSSSAAARDTP
jgi:5-methylcytosine-specific restriction endonuclease McrA